MPEASTYSKQRIAKNSIVLFIRMFITMIIGLYTSRVVLNTLGVSDYGIYNVVGAVVGIFGFISNSMRNASSRFIAVELGKGNKKSLSESIWKVLIFFSNEKNSNTHQSAIHLRLKEAGEFLHKNVKLNCLKHHDMPSGPFHANSNST